MSISIITGPTVRLVGRQVIDDGELSAFLEDEDVESWTTDTDIAAQKLVEVAGRLCYKSYAKPRPGGNSAYLSHIIEVGHGSVIEHAVFNFIITGVSRSFSHELVRHRAGWSYSQRSQRFCDESELAVVAPPALVDEVERAHILTRTIFNGTAVGVLAAISRGEITDVNESTIAGLKWLASIEISRTTYADLSDYLASKETAAIPESDRTLRRKRAREAARSVLPNATETQLFVTANARALRHFVELRGNVAADAEIKRVALAMLAILQAEVPDLFGDYRVKPEPGGGASVSTRHPKV